LAAHGVKAVHETRIGTRGDVFWQIHRSTLVNTKAIAGVSRDLRGRQLVAVKGYPEKLEVSFTGLFKGM
jgi:DNA-binding LytR/AlgR family response regulator